MRIAVMGTGAVGGYFGARLAAAGHELIFIARGQHLAALQTHGLRVTSPNGDLHIKQARCAGDPRGLEAADLILFCVKSYDTEAAAERIKPLVAPHTTLLSLQNGIDNLEKLGRFFTPEQILPAVVYIGAQVTAPGVIHHANGGRIIFGASAGDGGEPCQTVEQTLSGAAIPCEWSQEIHRVRWTKLLWNAPFCAISCLARATVKEIVESPSLTQLALDCMTEVQAAARLRGIELRREQFDEVMTISRAMGDFKPSMLQDLQAGKPLEYQAFNGIVVQILRQAGSAAPINQVFCAALQFLDQRNRAQLNR